MSKYVAVIVDGKLSVHMQDKSGNWCTLCGIDANDPTLGHFPADVPLGRKIDCSNCKRIFNNVKGYRQSDFEI